MDRGLFAAILAVSLLASTTFAAGSPRPTWRGRFRGLAASADEQDPGSFPPVDDERPLNQRNGGEAGPPTHVVGSEGAPSPPPVPGSESSSSVPPPLPYPASPGRTSPPPRQQTPPLQSPQSESPPPSKSNDSSASSAPSPIETSNTTHPEGSNGGGSAEPSADARESSDTCSGSPQQCPGNVIACFGRSRNGTDELFVLINNKGNYSVEAVISSLPTTKYTIPEHSSKKIPLKATPSSVILKVGGESCSLAPMSPVSVENFFRQFPQYATPEYGAYAAILIALVSGCTWVCCKCRKRSRTLDSGAPYQQLEMGVHDSTSAVATNGGDGWERGWDDDWEDEDEEAGSRSKEMQQTSKASTNGSTQTKPSVRDEWEDWDD